MNSDITVVIPTIPVRQRELTRAVRSVTTQTLQPDMMIIVMDNEHQGAAMTRNRALQRVSTRWVAFLDDDDVLLPNHLEVLADAALESGADVIYPGCRVINPELGGVIPLREEWGRFEQPFSADILRQKSYIPVTSLVRTGLAQRALFGTPHGVETNYDDWGFYLRLLDEGAMFSHVPVVTWIWNHHGANTSGRGDRW